MADPHTVTLLMSEFVTRDVRRFLVSRPPGFTFQAGQGVELAIKRPEWQDEHRPFTPSCLADDKILEFTIKSYPAHKGMTRELHSLSPEAELLLPEPFGTISYQGPEGGLAGGAGITPFLAIRRERVRAGDIDRRVLIFSNKTPADVICEKELRHYLGDRCILTCTEVQTPGYEYRRLDETSLGETIHDVNQHFYVCGSPGFMGAVNGALKKLGADPQSLVFER
ncbi:MAG: flavodoxin reductase [Gammaproteobacteria bacterium]